MPAVNTAEWLMAIDTHPETVEQIYWWPRPWPTMTPPCGGSGSRGCGTQQMIASGLLTIHRTKPGLRAHQPATAPRKRGAAQC
jgi:hypothetical protein